MYDKTLSYTVTQPYKSFIDIKKDPPFEIKDGSWCHSPYLNQTVDTLVDSAIRLQGDYLLQDLAETFNLSGELLAAAV